MATPDSISRFARQKTVLLTTYRRDGMPVGTPVHIATDGNHAYFRTYDASWKAKRLRRNPNVEVAPSTVRGKPIGEAIRGHARLLEGEEARRAARTLARKYRLLHRLLIPWSHRLKGWKTLHYELTILGDEPGNAPVESGRVER